MQVVDSGPHMDVFVSGHAINALISARDFGYGGNHDCMADCFISNTYSLNVCNMFRFRRQAISSQYLCNDNPDIVGLKCISQIST